jgi:PAS domain S-box-containing protein
MRNPIDDTLKAEILDNVPAIIAFHDLEHNILWANAAYQKATRLSLKKIEGRKCYSIWGLSKPCRRCPVTAAIETGESAEAELTPQNQDHWPDSQGSWLSKSSPLKDENGKVIGAIEMAFEISDRKEAEEALRESEEKYHNIFNNAQVGIFRTRISDGKILECNDRFARTYGYKTPEECMADFVISEHYTDPSAREKMITSLMEKEEVNDVEACFSLKDGDDVWVRFSARAYPKEGYLGGVGYDITEEKKALEALQESEEKFRLISEQLLMAIVIVQDDGIRYANQAYLAMTGYTWEEIMNWTLGDTAKLIHPDDRHFVMEQGRKKAAGVRDGVAAHSSYRGVKKNGEVRWIDQYSKTITYREKPADLITFIDIHDQKLAQETLRQSEKKYKELADSLPQVIFETDERGKLTFVNRNAFDLFGYSQHDFDRGINAIEMLIPEDRNRAMENIQRVMRGEGSGSNEYTALTKEGSTFPISIHSNILIRENRPMGIRGIIIDLTQSKKAEEALRESKERFRETIELLPSIVCEYDTKGRFTYVNRYGLDAFGYTLSDLENGLYATQMFASDEIAKFKDRFNLLLRGKRQESIEYRLQRKDGSITYVIANSAPIYKDGKMIGARSNITPITERKQIEEALRESERRYRLLADNVSDVIWTRDMNLHLTYISPSITNLTGYTVEEAMNRTLEESWPTDSLKLFKEVLAKEFEIEKDAQKDLYRSRTIEVEVKRKGGSTIWTESKMTFLRDKDDKPVGIIGVTRDITERKRADEEKKKLEIQLQRAQKMEAMGLMAGGVAHDLNNILSGIVSYPELLLMDLPEDSPLREPIKTIKESGMRAVDVVADLLTIARGVATGKEISNLNTLIEGYLSSAEHQKLAEMYPFITFKTEIGSDLLNINCSPTHIKKILMNLVTNASEAIEGSGVITISTKNRYLDEPLKGYEDVRTGEYVMLTISDDGSGISPGDLERIFEPFYTKKVMGRSGTGLGLAVVWNTVQDHKGYINVNTSEKGTVFELYFPVTRDEVTAEKEEVPLEDYLGHGEKILVVDDEERQREIAGGMLAKLGYNAETVSSGEEAVEYVKEYEVDLILLDMIMPKGINGRETYAEIVKIRPGQKAVIASGYAKTKEVDLAQELGAGKYIKKPYTLAKVGLAVKEELEK